MSAEKGPLIPLGILLDRTHAAKKAVRVLKGYEANYQSIITIAASETLHGSLDEIRYRRRKARDTRVRMDKLTEQLKDYENLKAEGKGKKPRFKVDPQKLQTFLATKEQRDAVNSDITSRAHELLNVSH